MEKKIAKIGIIAVLTLALILSSLGALNLGGTFAKEFDVGAGKQITAQAASTPIWGGGESYHLDYGTGTKEDPYLISKGEELAYLRNQVNAGNANFNAADKYYKLTADIFLNDTTNWTNWNADTVKPKNSWTPIGDGDREFAGVFDGDGHAVFGIYICPTRADKKYYGLFGSISGTVKNLGVEKSYIYSKGSWSFGGGTGGIAGYNRGTVINCYNSGTISGMQISGGIVGLNSSGKVINCYNTGTFRAIWPDDNNSYIGGVVGENRRGEVINCYSTGEYIKERSDAAQEKIGGVVGGSDTTAETANKLDGLYFLQSTAINKNLYAVGYGSRSSCV